MFEKVLSIKISQVFSDDFYAPLSKFQNGTDLKNLLKTLGSSNLIVTEDLTYAHNCTSEALVKNAWLFVITPPTDTKSIIPRQKYIANELLEHGIYSNLQLNSQGMNIFCL